MTRAGLRHLTGEAEREGDSGFAGDFWLAHAGFPWNQTESGCNGKEWR